VSVWPPGDFSSAVSEEAKRTAAVKLPTATLDKGMAESS
jgi:hypothetical protein